jgi:hypothetical protein
MATTEPEMRAAQTQSLVSAIDTLPRPDREAVHVAAGSQAFEVAKSSLAIAWLPLSLHMKIADAARDTIGSERALLLWRQVMKGAFERPILRTFVSVKVNVFRSDPGGFLRHATPMYAQLARNVGTIGFAPLGKGEGRVTLRGFPSRDHRFICYVEGLQGCLDAFYPLCRTFGTTVVESSNETLGQVSYHLRWEI